MPLTWMQLPGVKLTGLRWHGRTFDLSVAPRRTTLTVRSGKPLPVRVAGGRLRTVKRSSPLVVGTTRPDLDPTDDLARCRPVTASASAVGSPPVAAVDGSAATAWEAGAPGASLVVDLGATHTIARVEVRSASASTTPFSLLASLDGRSWHVVGSGRTAPNADATLDVTPVEARWVRYDAGPGAVAEIAALLVTAPPPTP